MSTRGNPTNETAIAGSALAAEWVAEQIRAAEARGYRKAIARLRDELLATAVQRKFADEWHQVGLYGGTPLDRAPAWWTVTVVLDALADYLEAEATP